MRRNYLKYSPIIKNYTPLTLAASNYVSILLLPFVPVFESIIHHFPLQLQDMHLRTDVEIE